MQERDKERAFAAEKYFLFAFKKYISNSNGIIAKRFSPSVRELLIDYIEIYEDMISKSENEKLKKSKMELIQSINFYLKESIFYKEKIYKEEFEYLLNDFEDIYAGNIKQAEENRVYNKCKSLVKKIDNENIYKKLVNVLKNTTSYEVVDKVIDAFVSELLYDEISLEYMNNWYTKNISRYLSTVNDENINDVLEHFSSLYKEENEFTYYISIKSKGELQEKIYLESSLILNREDYDKLELIDEKSNKNEKSYLPNGGDNYIYSISIMGKDYFKGLELICESISSYFQIVNYTNDENKIALNDKVVIKIADSRYVKKRNEKCDGNILLYNSEKRQKSDIKDFIEYRDKVYLNNIKPDEISNIQRAINIIENQSKQSKENKLINLWSVLEYMLTFHEGSSIIAKVKDIIPKVICLYYIKDKINMFWNDVNLYSNSKKEIIHEIISECKVENDDYRYDLEKFINYLERKQEKIVTELEFNDNLKRQIAEIGMLLFVPKIRKEIINKKYTEVEMDLIRIYRDRNILIHSGRRDIKNLDYKSLRLYYYNRAVLGVIIHYKKKNPNLTIEEILNSIEYTYEKYISEIESSELINICRMKYLFIS